MLCSSALQPCSVSSRNQQSSDHKRSFPNRPRLPLLTFIENTQIWIITQNIPDLSWNNVILSDVTKGAFTAFFIWMCCNLWSELGHNTQNFKLYNTKVNLLVLFHKCLFILKMSVYMYLHNLALYKSCHKQRQSFCRTFHEIFKYERTFSSMESF